MVAREHELNLELRVKHVVEFVPFLFQILQSLRTRVSAHCESAGCAVHNDEYVLCACGDDCDCVVPASQRTALATRNFNSQPTLPLLVGCPKPRVGQ